MSLRSQPLELAGEGRTRGDRITTTGARATGHDDVPIAGSASHPLRKSAKRYGPVAVLSAAVGSRSDCAPSFIAGAEAEWRKRTGLPMTADELERVLRRYPGDS